MNLNNLLFICQSNLFFLPILLLGMASGCVTTGGVGTSPSMSDKFEQQDLPSEAFENIDNIMKVDCLLPGEMIQMGMNNVWVTPPRPAVISVWQCQVNGGQYSLNRSVDGRTMALTVWKGQANNGDKKAQNFMGEIYGKSWDNINPDYVQAAKWYKKAADQGYSRAQNNLGFLYENGFGVTKNKTKALQLYRQSMGVVNPIKLDQTSKGEINELEYKFDQAIQTTETLQKQLKESKEIARNQQIKINDLNTIQVGTTDIQQQLRIIRNDLAETRSRENGLKERLSVAKQQLETASGQLSKTETRVALKDLPNMGEYYALIIGINDYSSPLVNLNTPVKDAKRIAKLLQSKYGFNTTLLLNQEASREGIYKALYGFQKKIREKDNLLIYFAGHGDLSKGSAYWLPQDSDSENTRGKWISTNDITLQINFTDKSIAAKHVLIVADSCYGAALAISWIEAPSELHVAALPKGLLTRSNRILPVMASINSSVIFPQPDGLSVEQRVGWIRAQYMRPSRKILTSGGIEPVLDKDVGNGLSIFANAFLGLLETNKGIIGAEEIYKTIGPQVVDQAIKIGNHSQTPVYAPLREAGDNFGEFFFVSRH